MPIITEQKQAAMPCDSCGKKHYNRVIETYVESQKTKQVVGRLYVILCEGCRKGLADDLRDDR